MNPSASLITGVVCGVRVENVDDPLMCKICYLDKVVDELAKGWSIPKIERVSPLSQRVSATELPRHQELV